VVHELAGWRLMWARLELTRDATVAAVEARRDYEESARARWTVESLAAHPTVSAVRRLFRAAGTDPTRYRPSSEALLRRVLRGEALPAIHPLVDLNNCVSIALAVPSCVMATGSMAPPVRLRAGRAGERMESLRGDFPLAGKPLLEDGRGPFGTPITDSRRVAVEAETLEGWLVAYVPWPGPASGEVDEVLVALSAVASLRERFDSSDG
jgi:DNA/RNA-binding domain of Phe-tRNA-synthetase-like protein